MENKKILYILIAIIIIIGAIVCKVKGFNIESAYKQRQEIVLSQALEIEVSKVEEIAKEILGDKYLRVQKVEQFGNAVEISATEITEEEKEKIVSKVNETYNEDIKNENIDIISVPNTKIRDILKPYILPTIITFSACLLYFVIIYHKIGLAKVLGKGIVFPIAMELLYYSIIAIARIPFGRVTNAIAVGIYVLAIMIITVCFKNEKDKLKENIKKEND